MAKDLPNFPPKIKGSPNRQVEYICSVCGRNVGSRDNLVAKMIVFRGVGKGKSAIRSRTIAWLCIIPNGPTPSCRDKDVHWNLDPFETSPGMKGTSLGNA